MKILPSEVSEERQISKDRIVESVTRKIALAIAFISVFIFFFKLLFF